MSVPGTRLKRQVWGFNPCMNKEKTDTNNPTNNPTSISIKITVKYVVIHTSPSRNDNFHIWGNSVTCNMTLFSATTIKLDKTHWKIFKIKI